MKFQVGYTNAGNTAILGGGKKLVYHRLTNAAVKTIAEEDFGIRIEFKILKLRDYMDWLALQSKDNTPESRAQFCAL